MKIGLYLQNASNDKNKYEKAKEEYKKIAVQCKKAKLDILVCPEVTYSVYSDILAEMRPLDCFEDNAQRQKWFKTASDIADEAGCPVVYGDLFYYGKDRCYYEFYCNPWATGDETKFKMYIKNTITEVSPLSNPDYAKLIDEIFEPIRYKGAKIGMTICYDNYAALFSRAYGINGMEILINCTGSHVDYYKWSNLQRARAIENRSYAFCTMNYYNKDKINKSNVFGYSPQGACLIPNRNDKKCNNRTARSVPGSLYVYEFDPGEKDTAWEPDERISQKATPNKYKTFFLKQELP